MEKRYSFRQQKNYDMLPDGRVRVYYDEQEVESTEQVEGGEPIPVIDYTYLVADADSFDRNAIIVALLRTQYTADDEFAIQRQKDDKPADYNHYYAFVEKCKAIATRVLEGDNIVTAKLLKVAELGVYGASEAVNSFSVGGVDMWLGPARRVELRSKVEALKAQGQPSVPFAGLVIPVDAAMEMLSAIEAYAAQCSFVTDSHKAAINTLDTIEAVEAYDFTHGYPDKLNF